MTDGKAVPELRAAIARLIKVGNKVEGKPLGEARWLHFAVSGVHRKGASRKWVVWSCLCCDVVLVSGE